MDFIGFDKIDNLNSLVEPLIFFYLFVKMNKKFLILFFTELICFSSSLNLRNVDVHNTTINVHNITINNETNVITDPVTNAVNHKMFKTSFVFDGVYTVEKMCEDPGCDFVSYELYCKAITPDFGNCTYYAGNFNFVFFAKKYAEKHCLNGTIIKKGLYDNHDYVCIKINSSNSSTTALVIFIGIAVGMFFFIYCTWKCK